MNNTFANVLIQSIMSNPEIQASLVEAVLQSIGGNTVAQAPVQEPVAPVAPAPVEQKTEGFWKKPVAMKWIIGTTKINRTPYYYIDFENHFRAWSAPSQLARKAIVDSIDKSLTKETWQEIKVTYTKKDGTKAEKIRYGNKLKSNAELLLSELPKGFLPQTLNSYKPEKKSQSTVDYSDFI